MTIKHSKSFLFANKSPESIHGILRNLCDSLNLSLRVCIFAGVCLSCSITQNVNSFYEYKSFMLLFNASDTYTDDEDKLFERSLENNIWIVSALNSNVCSLFESIRQIW